MNSRSLWRRGRCDGRERLFLFFGRLLSGLMGVMLTGVGWREVVNVNGEVGVYHRILVCVFLHGEYGVNGAKSRDLSINTCRSFCSWIVDCSRNTILHWWPKTALSLYLLLFLCSRLWLWSNAGDLVVISKNQKELVTKTILEEPSTRKRPF